MKPIYHYASVSEALTELKAMGFTEDFNLQEENIKAHPHQYQVEHVYRYEGDSNPDDASVVYGIKTDAGEKGVFVAGYSANSENEAARILEKICIESSGQCEI